MERSGASQRHHGRWRCMVGLLGVCALHGVVLVQFWSPAWLGFPHDDTLYLAAGKALAEGAGALFPSLPGEPAQTKYPPLYPILLSAFWRIGNSLDGILVAAFWLNWACGAAFLAGSFVLIRQLGLGTRTALGLSAVMAAHPAVIGLNLLMLSDIPFMALSVWSLVVAHSAAMPAGDISMSAWGRSILLAALLTLAVLTRSLGIATIAAVAGYGWWSPRRVPLVTAAMLGGVAFGAQSWWAWRHATGLLDNVNGGLHQTWVFYTSYAGFWQLCLPDWRTFGAAVGFNLREVLKEPAIQCFLLPVTGFEGGLLQMVGVAVSVGVIKGVIGLAREHGFHPAHAALALHVPVIVAWNYPLAGRFLLLFLPLFLAGAWHECSKLTLNTIRIFRGSAPWSDRAVCAIFMAAVAVLPVYAAYRIVWWSPRSLARAVSHRETSAAENREAMAWIRSNSSDEVRFIAYQDASLYLQTGRQAIRPMAFRTSALYLQDESILNSDLAGIEDVVRGIGAQYWLRADDDFHLEVGEEKIAQAVDDLLAGSPVVFRSSEGRVRIHALIGQTISRRVAPQP